MGNYGCCKSKDLEGEYVFTPKNNKVQITFQDDNTENKTSNYNSEAQTNKIIKNENKEKSTKNTKDKNHSSDNRSQISNDGKSFISEIKFEDNNNLGNKQKFLDKFDKQKAAENKNKTLDNKAISFKNLNVVIIPNESGGETNRSDFKIVEILKVESDDIKVKPDSSTSQKNKNNEKISKVNNDIVNGNPQQSYNLTFEKKNITIPSPEESNKKKITNSNYEAKRDKIFNKNDNLVNKNEQLNDNKDKVVSPEETRLENLKTKDMLKALKKGKENKKEVVYSEKIQNLKKLLENHILQVDVVKDDTSSDNTTDITTLKKEESKSPSSQPPQAPQIPKEEVKSQGAFKESYDYNSNKISDTKKESYSNIINDKPKPVKQKQKMAKKNLNLDIIEDS